MSSQRSRILNRIAGGCVVAAIACLPAVAVTPDSMSTIVLPWTPIAGLSLLSFAGLLARVASWQPAPRPAVALPAARPVLALPAVPARHDFNGRQLVAVRTGQRRNELAAVQRPVRAALPAAPGLVSEHDERMKRDVNDAYARRDRGELTDQQWMDKLKQVHDTHKAACKAEWDQRNAERVI